MVKAEAGQDFRGPRLRRVGVDIGEAGVDFGDAHAVGDSLRLLHQGGTLDIGGKYRLQQAFRPARRFLRQDAKPRALAQLDTAAVGMQLPRDQLEQRRFPRAIAPDQAKTMANRHMKRGSVQQGAARNAVCQVLDLQHGPLSNRKRGGLKAGKWRDGGIM